MKGVINLYGCKCHPVRKRAMDIRKSRSFEFEVRQLDFSISHLRSEIEAAYACTMTVSMPHSSVVSSCVAK